jgi:hypothetical protein
MGIIGLSSGSAQLHKTMMMGQRGLKHIGVDMFYKHDCNSNELCAFIGLCCGNRIIMHGMKNVKFGKPPV